MIHYTIKLEQLEQKNMHIKELFSSLSNAFKTIISYKNNNISGALKVLQQSKK